MKENHDIDWDSAKIVEKRERDDQARGIKEAVYNRILPNIWEVACCRRPSPSPGQREGPVCISLQRSHALSTSISMSMNPPMIAVTY